MCVFCGVYLRVRNSFLFKRRACKNKQDWLKILSFLKENTNVPSVHNYFSHVKLILHSLKRFSKTIFYLPKQLKHKIIKSQCVKLIFKCVKKAIPIAHPMNAIWILKPNIDMRRVELRSLAY